MIAPLRPTLLPSIRLEISLCQQTPFSEYSMQLNASRIKVLQAPDDLVNAMREAASEDLLNHAAKAEYAEKAKVHEPEIIVTVGSEKHPETSYWSPLSQLP
ncbi:hypothetical protein Tco_0653173 [Tanacetum coccineum]|uniref:Uncharacterized protein n=1 Tax=Tanacetum coccineum TaxID=301880 RepID=A0ABQ4WZS5_9ASTR